MLTSNEYALCWHSWLVLFILIDPQQDASVVATSSTT